MINRLCQIRCDDAGEHDPVERPGTADPGNAGGDLFNVTQVKQILADERVEQTDDKSDGIWRLYPA